MNVMPLVSCIMLTRNRRIFAGQAITYFKRQDYAQKELVIIDDGEDEISDLVPARSEIRYIRLPKQLSLGAIKNIACEHCRGELIAHWDDDDWIAPNRLSVQANRLREYDSDVCSIRDVIHYQLDKGEAYLYRSGDAQPLGKTLMYWRWFWEANPFQETVRKEDMIFLREVEPNRLEMIEDTHLYVAMIHGGNINGRNIRDPHWQPLPLEEVTQLLATDQRFYIQLRTGYTQHTKKKALGLTVAAPFLVYDGYGSMGEYLVLGLARCGVKINIYPFRIDEAGISRELQDMLKQSEVDLTAPALCLCWPLENFEPFRRASDLFINTMWESSQLPAGWAKILNRARALIVPSKFVKETFQNSGVTVPIQIVPQGVDPAIYHYEDRPNRSSLTTLMVGVITPRKNIREGVEAWKLAFSDDPTAQLIIKARFQCQAFDTDDTRIQVVDTNETTRGISHWYQKADVLMALGNEGFGLPLLEGMATGLPVIALNTEGQADVCQAAPDCLLTVPANRWEPFVQEPFGACGVRAIPDIETIAHHLRWVANHRAEAQAMGRRASAWVLKNRNIWAMGPAILQVIHYYTGVETPSAQTSQGPSGEKYLDTITSGAS